MFAVLHNADCQQRKRISVANPLYNVPEPQRVARDEQSLVAILCHQHFVAAAGGLKDRHRAGRPVGLIDSVALPLIQKAQRWQISGDSSS